MLEDLLGAVPEVLLRLTVLASAFVAGFYSLRLAYVRARSSPIDLIGEGSNSLTLLLRSFNEDRHRYGGLFDSFRVEHLLDWELGRTANFVAIGDPREAVASSGAARAYVDDARWQDLFRRLATRSTTIVAIAGSTTWIRWELEQIVELGKLAQTVLVIPDADPLMRGHQLELLKLLAPEAASTLSSTEAAQLKCVTFRADRAPCFVFCPSASKNAMRASITAALGARDERELAGVRS